MADPEPEVDDRHPADVVTAMVDHVLQVAASWPPNQTIGTRPRRLPLPTSPLSRQLTSTKPEVGCDGWLSYGTCACEPLASSDWTTKPVTPGHCAS
jgi:hypothetical protein